MGNVNIGFPDYGTAVVGENGVIVKGSLTSLASIQGSAATLVGVPTFSANGMTGSNGAGTSSGIATPIGAGSLTAIAKQWTWSFEISTKAFDKRFVPTVAENFLVVLGGTTWILNREILANSGYVKMFNGGTVMNGTFYTAADGWFPGNGTGRGEFSQVHLTCDDGGMELWVDYFPLATARWDTRATKTTGTNFCLNSSGTSNGGTYTYRNLMISTKKMVIPKTTHRARVTHGYGDSYVAGRFAYADKASGGQQQTASGCIGIGPTNPTPDGKSGTGYDGPVQGFNDACTFATIRRTLAKNNIYVNKFGMWAHGGSGLLVVGSDGINKTQDRVTKALTMERPDIAIYAFGYNDATTNGNAGPSDLVAYQALLQTSVNEVLAKNPDCIIIICTLPYKVEAQYTATLQAVLNVNAAFKAVADATPAVTLDDKFTQWGGANGDPSYFQTADPHPTDKGTQHYGVTIANIIIDRLIV